MDGVIIIDKEKGYTSRDVVNIVGKTLKTKKVGHTGTLDPLATGVLVLGVNKACKILELLFSDEKEYIAEVKLGVETDTLDTTGTVIHENKYYTITKENVLNALNHFQGKYMQEVPIYSAVKINGKKLYQYARNNEEVELPKREVHIKEIELLNFSHDSFSFRCVVSKGTYIRSLIRDIGDYLGIYCTMSALRRTKQGIFNIEDAVKLEDIKDENYRMVSIKEALKNYKQIEVDEELKFKIENGQKLKKIYDDDIIVFTYQSEVVAIYKKDEICYKAMKVFY